MKLRSFLSTLVCGLLLASQVSAQTSAPFVTLEEARAAVDKSTAVVLDIREPGEQTTGVVKGALLIPMGQVARRVGELSSSDQKPLLVICNTQNRSLRIVEQLQAAGFTNARFHYVSLGYQFGLDKPNPGVKNYIDVQKQ